MQFFSKRRDQNRIELFCARSKERGKILCSCHESPMTFDPEKIRQHEAKGLKLLCDVCLAIDRTWSRNYVKMLKLWDVKKEQMEASDDWEEKLKFPTLPSLEYEVRGAIDNVLTDFNTYRKQKYDSICEQKLMWAKKRSS